MSINATFFGEIISFLFFIFFCTKYIWPPIINSINEREKKIFDALLSVKNAKDELLKIKMQTLNEIKKSKKISKLIINKANQDKIKIIEMTKLKVQEEQKKIIEESCCRINNEYEIVKEKLRKETTLLVIYCVEKILKQSMNNNINEKIVNEFISSLDKHNIYV